MAAEALRVARLREEWAKSTGVLASAAGSPDFSVAAWASIDHGLHELLADLLTAPLDEVTRGASKAQRAVAHLAFLRCLGESEGAEGASDAWAASLLRDAPERLAARVAAGARRLSSTDWETFF